MSRGIGSGNSGGGEGFSAHCSTPQSPVVAVILFGLNPVPGHFVLAVILGRILENYLAEGYQRTGKIQKVPAGCLTD